MKRRVPTLLDELKDKSVPTSRVQYTSTNVILPNTSNKWKHIRTISSIIIVIFIVAFIHIIKQTKQASIYNTLINNDSNTNPLQHTDNLLKDNRNELINTDDIIIKHQKQSTTSMEDALSFTNEDCTNKLECGRCWLYNNLNLVIQISSIIQIPNHKLDTAYKDLHLLVYWVTFRSLNNEICTAKDITIYVSIIGANSESVGGLAMVDNTSLCGWKYKWIVSQSDTYKINAYLLYYRGYLDFNQNNCLNQKNIQYVDTSLNTQYTLTRLPTKWRFYGQVEGCCEWCNRMKDKCLSWSSGPGDKCILFTQNPFVSNSNIVIEKHNGYISGLYRGEAQQWYLGSLLNIQPNQCHNTKLDLIYPSPMQYTINFSLNEPINNNNLCATNQEMGRWIRLDSMDCSNKKEFNSWCWIKLKFDWLPYRWSAYQCSYLQRTPSNVHKCLIKNKLNRIAIGGDSLIRLFSIEMVRYIFGGPLLRGDNVEHWSYSKHYQSSDTQVWFMGYDHNIDDISFMKEFIVNKQNANKPNVFIHNFQVIHKMWHQNVTQFTDLMRSYKQMANELFQEYYDVDEMPLRMIFEAPLLVSEREYHDTGDRAVIYNKIMRDVFEADGWIFISVFEISKARMYDSTNKKDGVIDGMHMSSNILIEIARITIDMLCRFELKNHTLQNALNPLYMSV